MRVDDEVRGQLAARFVVLLPHLNERQQRLALATEARLLGRGGLAAVAAAARVSPTTVRRGVTELDAGEEPFSVGRSRRPGGGRKAVTAHDPDLVTSLLGLIEPDERGDPMSPLRWTTKSLRHLAAELTERGHPVSAPTVGQLLRANGFSLQGTAKTLEGAQHPDRDAQGGFKWSSQHLGRGGTRGQTGWVDEGVDGEVGDEVAGSPVSAPGRGASVLARDRQGPHERGGGDRGRRVAGGWFPLVPGAWRDAFAQPDTAVRKISVTPGT
jgi:hypothetical protein